MVGYEDASVMEEYWLRSLGLSLEDRQCLRKGGWLTDSVINAGQVLLRTDYTQIGGLQPTTLGEVLGFTSQGSPFIQVIHTVGSHWITASNVGFQEGVVGIYDICHRVQLQLGLKRILHPLCTLTILKSL